MHKGNYFICLLRFKLSTNRPSASYIILLLINENHLGSYVVNTFSERGFALYFLNSKLILVLMSHKIQWI